MKRIYGDAKTHLTLTKAARAVYDDTMPISIEEVETDDGFLYNITGCIERSELTEDEVNNALIELAFEDE